MDQCNFKPVYNKDNRKRPQVGVQCRSSTHLFSYRYLLPRDREKAGALSLLFVGRAVGSTGYQPGTTCGTQPGGILPCVRSPKAVRQVQVDSQSPPPEQVYQIQAFQDGVYLYGNKSLVSRLLYADDRPQGHIFACANTSGFPEIPQTSSQGEFGSSPLPIQGTTIWTSILSEDFHEGPGRGPSSTARQGHYSNSLFGQTSVCHPVLSAARREPTRGTTFPAFSWLDDQSGQVPAQEVQYLGYRISSIERKVFLPSEKIEKVGLAVVQLQTNQDAHVRDVMRVMGLMTSCFGQGFISIRYRLSFCSAGMAASRVGINLCLYPQKSKGHYGGGEPITS